MIIILIILDMGDKKKPGRDIELLYFNLNKWFLPFPSN